MKDPTKRFSDRVGDYVKYRPHYPESIPDLLRDGLGLERTWTVVDVGSGTGLSSERFAQYGCAVIGVEPNAEMRSAAELFHSGAPRFRSVDGRAEATGLAPESADLYVSGQAFHWFDRDEARAEALRILRPPKRALLMWNDWERSDSPFLSEYGVFIDARMPEHKAADHRNLADSDFDAFFGKGRWKRAEIPNQQRVDFPGLKGRLLSASYAPKEGDPGFEGTMAELEGIFDRHAVSGLVDLGYTTILRFGEMAG